VRDDEAEIDLIEQYHKGLLNKEKLDEFFEREKSDKDFSAKVKAFKEIMEGINYHGQQKSISDSILLWEKEIKEKTVKVNQNDAGIIPLHRKSFYFVAASIVGLLIIGAIFLFRPAPPDTLALFDSNFRPYPNILFPTMRGETSDGKISKQAFTAYDRGDYQKAAEYLNEWLMSSTEANNDLVLLYLGNCYLAVNDLAAAKKNLEQIGEGSVVADQRNWYLALAYLKSGEAGRAENVLDKLLDHPNTYSDKARKIISRLD
jgi:tetratricopeptide (TPR) repeat protein